MATIDLGKIKFVNRGAYNNSTAYTPDDVVTSGGSSYICKLASTGNAVTNTTYWDVLAQKGTDGTDVGTTLTTQGDILYRDGSGLQRLAKGTAGQALKMNSSANAPEWGTISSDFVNLASHRSTNQHSTISIDGYFSSTYDHYLIRAYIIDEKWLKFRFNVGGSTHTGGNWNWVNDKAYRSSSTSSSQIAGSFNSDYCPVLWHSQNTSVQSTIEILIANPLNASKYKTIVFNTSGYNTSAEVQHEHGAGYFHGTSGALSGFTFVQSNGNNFDDIGIDLYGLK